MLYLVLVFLAFVCHIWLVVRVWSHAGALWGLGTLFIPFVALIYILVHWSEEDGAKLPFFIGIALSIIAVMNPPTVSDFIDPASLDQDQVAMMMQDPEMQRLMDEDPAFRAQMEAIAAQSGQSRAATPSDSEASADEDFFAEDAAPARPRPPVALVQSYSATEQQGWRLAFENLPRTEGRVAIKGANATIMLPDRFRFIERDRLRIALAAVQESMDPAIVGWIVHADAPIADRYNAWWIEVRALDQGHVALGDAASGDVDAWKDRAFDIASREGKASGKLLSFLGFPVAPYVDETTGTVAFVGSYGAGGEQAHLCTGLALGRERQVAFTMRAKYDDAWRELCFLSVKVLAQRTTFDPNQGFADYTRFVDDRADHDVVDYFVGAARAGKGL